MQTLNSLASRPTSDLLNSTYSAIFAGSTIAAVGITLFIANFDADLATKSGAFAALVASFLIVLSLLQWTRSAYSPRTATTSPLCELDLAPLDEAIKLFAGKMTTFDSFRLAAFRVAEIVPFEAANLFLLNESRTELVLFDSFANDPEPPSDEADSNAAEPASTVTALAKQAFATNSLQIAGAAVAMPLAREGNAFGVIELSFATPQHHIDSNLLNAIAHRISPMVLAGLSLDRSRVHALTDATTDLPNERAFRLMLEDQIAHTTNNPAAAELAILAFDVLRFDGINSRFGHAAGDEVLNFVAQVVLENLREMDFLARTRADEFLVILPTASIDSVEQLITRLTTALKDRSVEVADRLWLEVELGFGWASFGPDGDTSASLLAAARTRREQSKHTAPPKVLWFPSETAH